MIHTQRQLLHSKCSRVYSSVNGKKLRKHEKKYLYLLKHAYSHYLKPNVFTHNSSDVLTD